MFSFANQYEGRVSSEEGVTQNKPQLGHCRNHLQTIPITGAAAAAGDGELDFQSWQCNHCSEQSRHDAVGGNDLDVKTIKMYFSCLINRSGG